MTSCELLVMKNDKIQLLRDNFLISKKLYYSYLLNFVDEYWRNIYLKFREKIRKNNLLVVNINNVFRKLYPLNKLSQTHSKTSEESSSAHQSSQREKSSHTKKLLDKEKSSQREKSSHTKKLLDKEKSSHTNSKTSKVNKLSDKLKDIVNKYKYRKSNKKLVKNIRHDLVTSKLIITQNSKKKKKQGKKLKPFQN